MTPEEFKSARYSLGVSQEVMGRRLGGYAVRTVASWESGERAIPPAVAVLLTIMLMTS